MTDRILRHNPPQHQAPQTDPAVEAAIKSIRRILEKGAELLPPDIAIASAPVPVVAAPPRARRGALMALLRRGARG